MKPVFPSLETLTDAQNDVLVIAEIDGPDTSDGFRVILYDDDHTPVDLVVEQLVKATGYTLEKAARITSEVEIKGRAVCFNGSREQCHKVARVLREIRLQCEVDCD
ncbi:MAG TPA: ATP-dependent Clp protease adaptor ClpS [Abditibacterium sp.]|jgi:ATP-dependent Clp protease adapter protein ClpS